MAVLVTGSAARMAEQMAFAHTSWAGIELDHPAEWELFRVVRKADRWRCGFTDRTHQRIDMRWRKLDYVPSLAKMLERYQEKEKKEQTAPLTGQTAGWMGTIRQTEGGSVVNAGTFLEEAMVLVEMILVWPGKRDQELENVVLRSVRPMEVKNGTRLWQAMGLKARMSQEYDIVEYTAEAGRVEWVMGKGAKPRQKVAMERLAMPKYWLKGTLSRWLRTREQKWQVLEEWNQNVSGHEAAGQRASSRGLLVDSLLLKKKVKTEMAWLCDKEQRVYRLACMATQRQSELALPDDVEIICCNG
jgi:hypothetical protein